MWDRQKGLIQIDHIHRNRWPTQGLPSLFFFSSGSVCGRGSTVQVRRVRSHRHTQMQSMHTHKQAYIYVGEVWRGIQLTVSHSYLQWRFDFTDLICALPMLGGSQDWINDHPPALTLSFHLIVSQWVSQHLIFPLGTSACTPPAFTSLLSNVCPFCWTILLFSHLCIGSPFLASAVDLSLANDFLPQEQAVGTKQEPPEGIWISQHWSKKKNGRVSTLTLIFRTELIIIDTKQRNNR